MLSLLDQLSSPAWWVSVVIVGIVINLIAAYLKTPLDRGLGKLSIGWSNRTERQRRERAERILLMRNSQDARLIALFEIVQLKLWAVLFFQVSTLFGVLGMSGFFGKAAGVWTSGFFMALMALGAFQSIVHASARLGELVEARRA